MKNLWIVVTILVLLALAAGAFFLFTGKKASGCTKENVTKAETVSTSTSASSSADLIEGTVISFENGKFSPDCVLVKSGATVTFANKSDENIEIGANPHPIHTGNREVSNSEFSLPLAAGETAEVTLNKTGTTDYHDHLRSSVTGTIIVE